MVLVEPEDHTEGGREGVKQGRGWVEWSGDRCQGEGGSGPGVFFPRNVGYEFLWL